MPGAVYTKRGAARLAYLPISDFDLTFYVYGTGSSEFEINTLLIDKGSAKQGKTSGHIEKSEEKMFTVKASENNISIDEIRSLQWYLTRIIPPALAVSVIGLAAKIMRKRARGREPRTIAGERRSLR
jgi:hypothetical protein